MGIIETVTPISFCIMRVLAKSTSLECCGASCGQVSKNLTINSWSCNVRIIPAAVMCSHLHTLKISDGSSDFFSLFFSISRKLRVLHGEGSLLKRNILYSCNLRTLLRAYKTISSESLSGMLSEAYVGVFRAHPDQI